MGVFLFIAGMIGFGISLLYLVIYSIQKEPKKKVAIALGLSFVIFITGVIYPTSGDENTNASEEKPKEKKEVETSNENNKKEETKTEEKNSDIDEIQEEKENKDNIETDTNIEEEVDTEQQKEDEEKAKENEYKEAIIRSVGSDDTLENIELKGNDIIINIILGDPSPLTYKDLAISRYSSITDELLEEGNGLENITVEFKNVGSVKMNTSEKVTNEYGQSYFEQLEIEEQLNK